MAAPNFANGWTTTLAGSLTNVATSVVVASASGIPARPFRALVRAEGANTDELVSVTGLSGSTITIARAAEAIADGTQTASAHASGATISAVLTAGDLGAGFVQAYRGGREAVSTVASASTSQTLDLVNANVFDLTLDAASCALTLSGATSGYGCAVTVILRQDGTGGRAVTWTNTITWQGGAAPALASAASAVTTITLWTVNGGTNWFGSLAQGGAYASAVPWTSGTSMPGSPVTNQRITRTDLGIDFFYDGSRWLSVEVYTINSPNAASIAASTAWFLAADGTYDMYVTTCDVVTLSASAPSGTNYYTFDLWKTSTANVFTQLGSSFDNKTDSSATWTRHQITVNAVVATASYPVLRFLATKTASAPDTYCPCTIYYRRVGT